MIWTLDHCPRAMDHLPPIERLMAIEIANALFAVGYDEGVAVRVGISRAHEWSLARPAPDPSEPTP